MSSNELLAPELRAAIFPAYGQIAEDMILAGKKRKRAEKPHRPVVAGPPQTRAERRLSKSSQKKLARLEDERRKKMDRQSLFESLQKTELKPEEMAVLLRSGTLGHAMSAREREEKGLREQKAMALVPKPTERRNSGSLLIAHREKGQGGSALATVNSSSTDAAAATTNNGATAKGRQREASGEPPSKRVRFAGDSDDSDDSDAAGWSSSDDNGTSSGDEDLAAAKAFAKAKAKRMGTAAASSSGLPRMQDAKNASANAKRMGSDDDDDDGGGGEDDLLLVDEEDDAAADDGSDCCDEGADDDEGEDGEDDEEGEDDEDGEEEGEPAGGPRDVLASAIMLAKAKPTAFSFSVKLGKPGAHAPTPAAASAAVPLSTAPVDAASTGVSSGAPDGSDMVALSFKKAADAKHKVDGAMERLRQLKERNIAALQGHRTVLEGHHPAVKLEAQSLAEQAKQEQKRRRGRADAGNDGGDTSDSEGSVSRVLDEADVDREHGVAITTAGKALKLEPSSALAQVQAVIGSSSAILERVRQVKEAEQTRFRSAAEAVLEREVGVSLHGPSGGGPSFHADDSEAEAEAAAADAAFFSGNKFSRTTGSGSRSGKSKKAGSNDADMVAAAKEAMVSDPELLRAAMWSADGSRLLASAGMPSLLHSDEQDESPLTLANVLRTASSPSLSLYSAYTTRYVKAARSKQIQGSRMQLPVCGMEQEAMDVINNANDVAVLCGETGSGKTTQVPQFLYESGYGTPVPLLEPLFDITNVNGEPGRLPPIPKGLALFRGIPGMVGITQPRRVAATAMASRVSSELDLPLGRGKPPSLAAAAAKGAAPAPGTAAKPKKHKGVTMEEEETAPAAVGSLESHGGPAFSACVGYQVRYDASTVWPNTADLYSVDRPLEKGQQREHEDKPRTRSSTSFTAVKFMTDGILLREVSTDLLLRQYSALIIDEAHERNVNTDILIGLLSRAVTLRNTMAVEQALEYKRAIICRHKAYRQAYAAAQGAGGALVDESALPPLPSSLPLPPLKMIIMSATLRVEDFTANHSLFPGPSKWPLALDGSSAASVSGAQSVLSLLQGPSPPPLIKVAARQYPVTIHFSKKTEMVDYVGAAFSKAVKIHTRLPPGGMLIFLTGQQEIEDCCRRLRKRFDPNRRRIRPVTENEPVAVAKGAVGGSSSESSSDDSNSCETDSSSTTSTSTSASTSSHGSSSSSDVGLAVAARMAEDADSDQRAAIGDDGDDEASGEDDDNFTPVHVLPLYALLSKQQQDRVFEPPPEGHRLIVVATNVAETSLTIPGIRYVIDSGRVKRKVYDLARGTSKFEVGWISQSSGDQRAGRAGRTGPGHCYRLYSSAVFNDRFEKFEEPEVQRMPLESVLLGMKTLGIDCVSNFPWPSAPPAFGIHAAVRTLTNLGALVPRVRSVAVSATSDETGMLPAATSSSTAALSSIVSEALTPLGQAMAKLPIHPSMSRMLVLAAAQRGNNASLLDYAIAIAACLTVQQIFVMPSDLASGYGHGKSMSAEDGAEAGEDDKAEKPESGDDAVGDSERSLLAEIEREQQEEAAREEEEEARGDRVDVKTSEEAKRRAKLKAAEEKEKAKRKELRAQAAAAHARFRHPLSDALTMLMAVGAYSHVVSSGGGEKAGADFCRRNWLRFKAMREINQLRAQLHRAVYGELLASQASVLTSSNKVQGEEEADRVEDVDEPVAGGGDSGEVGELEGTELPARTTGSAAESRIPPFKLALAPFDATTANLLRQLIASGQVERIAKRAPPMEASALFEQAGISGKITRQLVPYISCNAGHLGPLFIHPLSACFDRGSTNDDGMPTASLPDYVCYSEVVHTSRAYMRGLTAVDASTLHLAASGTPLLRYEAPLESPAPWYEVNLLPADGLALGTPSHNWEDRPMCYRVPVFGDRAWKLAAVRAPYPGGDDDVLLRLFARALLEGQVVPAMKPFAAYYSLPPASITKRANQKRVVLLLEALRSPPITPALRSKLFASSYGPDGAVLVWDALTLAKVWRFSTPLFLKTEVKAWLPFEVQTKVDALWPGIVENFLSRVPKELVAGLMGKGE